MVRFYPRILNSSNSSPGVPALPPLLLGYRHFTQSPLYYDHSRLYHIPPSESEYTLFHIDSELVNSGPPIHPRGGHSEYCLLCLYILSHHPRLLQWQRSGEGSAPIGLVRKVIERWYEPLGGIILETCQKAYLELLKLNVYIFILFIHCIYVAHCISSHIFRAMEMMYTYWSGLIKFKYN